MNGEMNFMTDEILRQAIERQDDEFDSHQYYSTLMLDWPNDYAHELDTKLLQERLRSAVSRLPEYLREVVILRDLAELPYAGVGKILGISAATARV